MKFCYISMGSSVLRSFCLTVFLLSFSVNSQQLADYEVLESLSDNVSNKQNNKTNIPNDEFPDNENIIDSAPKNISDYTDENYSYFGDDEFNTSQKKRYNQEPLKHFGYDYFSNVPDTYAQVKNIPIPPEYLIGPGDNIKVILFGKENDEFTLEVSRSGEIFLPEIGPIYLAGLTFKDMQKTIQNIVTNKIIGTEVNVTLGELRNINIFVLGEAFQPGMYTVSALSTLTNSIFLSGGVSQNGSLRNIQLKRNGAVVSSFDFYDLLLNGDTSQDVRLSSGDVVFIPQAKKTVGIEGEVFRPGIYEVNEDESIQDLIRFAGSLKPKGDSNNIEILRVDKQKNGFSMLDIDQNNTNSTSLNYGDVVRVSSVSNNMNNAVLIKGHFQRTGFYPLSEGSKIGDLITPKNILAMTDLNYVLIKRENIINSKYQYIQIDLNKVFEDPNSDNNILIQDRDEIILLPRLIAKEQIETMLINESDISDLNKGYSEPDNMQSMSLLRRSIIKQQEAEEAPIYAEMATDDNIQDEKDYYEYQVYDYCVVPKEAIFELVTPDMPIDLTEICRRQLLNPVIDIINRYNSGQNQKTTVQVFGNVHFPGEYPLTINMSLRDAIKASGGLKDNTYSSQIELTSQNLFDKAITANRKSYSIEEDIESKNILLKSNDLITIKKVNSVIKTVTISGEVFFPGIYPVTSNQTLSELINRAGGLTEDAYIKGSTFIRESLRIAEQDRLKKATVSLRKKIALGSTTSAGINENTINAETLDAIASLTEQGDEEDFALGRLVINLEAILNKQSDDIFLEDKDSLVIPKKKQSILVIGEVIVPNSHVFSEAYDINDYINLSGGMTEFADNDNTYIIKANGNIISAASTNTRSGGFFRVGTSQLESGDTIVVPLELTRFDTLTATTEISQIIYQMAIAAAAVNSF